jgi:two-component system OmpR family sensor kinase
MTNQLSLRTRLLLAVAAIALVALAVADVAVYSSLRSYLFNQADSTLQLSHIAVEQAINDTDGAGGPRQLPSGGTSSALGASNFCAAGRLGAPEMFIEVRSASGGVVTGKECPAYVPGGNSYSPKLPVVITGYRVTNADPREPVTYFTVASTSAAGPEFRVRASQLSGGGSLIVAEPISSVSSTLDQLILLEIVVTGVALAGAMVLGLWLVRVGLRPLRDVVRTADSISGGDVLHRVPNANTRTEVGHVASALNVMLERIETSFAELQESESRLRRFVSDASHELRTPIAAVSAYAQLFHQGADKRDQDMPRVMEGIERETGRMAQLVDDLLLLARYDEPRTLAFEPVELVGLVAEAIETARMVGPAWPIDFIADEPVEVMGDWDALRQVVDNLFSNVRSHTPEGTRTEVRVRRIDDDAVVEVADAGPGITKEEAVAIFERFFRADPSRSRETGGAGLGLAIVATIVRIHGGRADATPRQEGGSLFRILLPAIDGAE